MMDISPLVHKKVSFKYMGNTLTINLSHALFSSYDIDTGTQFLLKALVPFLKDNPPKTILDEGTGTGIIGIACSKTLPNALVTMRDRDALALEFASENARLNNVVCKIEAGLLLENLQEASFDAIISNIPAKAGEPVLKNFIINAPFYATKDGIIAFVIVNTLSEIARSWIIQSHHEMLYDEVGNNHTVFIYKKTQESTFKMALEKDPLWIRVKVRGSVEGVDMMLKTAWSLPCFETIDFKETLVAKILLKIKPVKNLIVWNPGQGWIPKFCAIKELSSHITLASRDLQSLLVSSLNLEGMNISCKTEHTGILNTIENSLYDVIIIFPDDISNYDEEFFLVNAVSKLLNTKGLCLFVGSSSQCARFEKKAQGILSLNTFTKHKGNKALLYKKKE